MFQFFFKYPSTVFTKGHFTLLTAWPAWLLPVLIFAAVVALALLFRYRMRSAVPQLQGWRSWVLWGMQSALVALILFLLWQPALVVAELNSQQNIIAVVVDDSRSMSIADTNGSTREAAAIAALESGVLAGLQKRFQTRVFRLGNQLTPADDVSRISPTEPATHISDGLKQLATETADLPVGAILLLSDGGENAASMTGSGISADALQALRNRRLPVHTVGLGKEQLAHDVEVEDVSVAASAAANARIAATVTLTQRGYAGQKAKLTVRDGDKALTEREITLSPDGQIQAEPLFFPVGSAGAKSLTFSVEVLFGEENLTNNAVTRPILVSDTKRRILYVEGEPRWEYKFIRRAEEEDPTVQLVSMLRTSENKIYRQGISNPSELADGFPVRPEDLFAYAGIIIGSVDANYFTPLQQRALARLLSVPAEIAGVADIESSLYVTLFFLLRDRNLSLISVWNPSFFSILLKHAREWSGLLVRDIHDGVIRRIHLPPTIARTQLASPQRAEKVETCLSEAHMKLTDLWPQLSVVSCWGDAEAAPEFQLLERRFPDVAFQRKGLLATEGVITIPRAGAANIAAILSHFLEFLDDQGRPHLVHELEQGAEYSVVMTTSGGLWRYRLGDRVRVTGFLRRAPLLEFVGKEDGVCDLRGEKLNPAFAGSVLRELRRELLLPVGFAMLAPSRTPEAGYLLLVGQSAPATLATALDNKLRANPQYAYARDLGQLSAPRVITCGPNAAERYLERCIFLGQRAGDVKPTSLHLAEGWEDWFLAPGKANIERMRA